MITCRNCGTSFPQSKTNCIACGAAVPIAEPPGAPRQQVVDSQPEASFSHLPPPPTVGGMPPAPAPPDAPMPLPPPPDTTAAPAPYSDRSADSVEDLVSPSWLRRHLIMVVAVVAAVALVAGGVLIGMRLGGSEPQEDLRASATTVSTEPLTDAATGSVAESTTTAVPATTTTAPPATVPPTTVPVQHTLTGVFTVYQAHSTGGTGNPNCFGFRGFEDLGAGATVTVKDASGTIVGVGTLGPCRIIDQRTETLPGDASLGIPDYTSTWGWPQFDFTVPSLPDSAFYAVSISNRDGQNYSKADLEASGWRVELSVGEG